MTQIKPLPANDFASISRLDTCTVSNVIERFDVRPRNEGFIYDDVQCRFPHFAPMLGYAVTARIRSSTPPATSPPITRGCYYDRMDFWRYLVTLPEPRVIILQDVDRLPGLGAFVGEIHAQIALALNCVGCVTNGAVRNMPTAEKLGLQLFAGGVSVSHAYVHIVEIGKPVQVGGLKIQSGDLLHGDVHGVQSIPLDIAGQLPAVAARIVAKEQAIIALCRSPEFSLEKLRAAVSQERF